MQSNLFNHSVWYLQLSKDLGYSPPHASHSCISFRQEITDLVAREGASVGDAGWELRLDQLSPGPAASSQGEQCLQHQSCRHAAALPRRD